MSRCGDLAVGVLGLTLATWVLSPLSGIRFYSVLLAAFLSLGVCAIAANGKARSLLIRRALAPFYVFGILHAISFLALSSEYALDNPPKLSSM